MRHPTPHSTPVAPVPPRAPIPVTSHEGPALRGSVIVLTPEGDIELNPGVAIVGRDPNCEVPIHDDLASRYHARIRLSADVVMIEDLQSTNGVYVNGVRLAAQPRTLHDGDRLLIGTTELSVFALRPRAPRSGNVPT